VENEKVDKTWQGAQHLSQIPNAVRGFDTVFFRLLCDGDFGEAG
jgi:hypothetical protein